ncbi:MAG: pantetheine-phosphate adenylyltransferase [Erysipelotrichales bacterium]|nr:pantetheine-phosphate adenylyltransferase [Erysipelotrichales bacterium]
MKTALYAGSFDPFTNGHLHVVKTASSLFDKVIVVIGVNDQKKRHYDVEKMKDAIDESLKNIGLTNVEVITYGGLTIDIAVKEHANILIRGIRDAIDLAAEESIADFNFDLAGIDTIYIRAGIAGSISSSKVRELIKYDKDISTLVPTPICDLVKQSKEN